MLFENAVIRVWLPSRVRRKEQMRLLGAPSLELRHILFSQSSTIKTQRDYKPCVNNYAMTSMRFIQMVLDLL